MHGSGGALLPRRHRTMCSSGWAGDGGAQRREQLVEKIIAHAGSQHTAAAPPATAGGSVFHSSAIYSYRSASMGSIDDARRAGTAQAIAATAINRRLTAIRMAGLRELP